MITLPAALAFHLSWRHADDLFAGLQCLFICFATERRTTWRSRSMWDWWQPSPVTPSTDWIFLEAIDTLRSSPPWDVADFQRLLRWLKEDGFYRLEEHVKDPKKLPAQWARLRPQLSNAKGQRLYEVDRRV